MKQQQSIICFLLSSILICSNFYNNHIVVFGKEIIATHEWTKIGINDTIDSGFHVRIDMTTGEKWVKLLDNDNNDNSNALTITKDDTNHHDSVLKKVMTNEQRNSIDNMSRDVVRISDNDNPKSTDNNDNNAIKIEKEYKPQHQYNFDVMYRTLAQLPDDEKIAMELPELLPSLPTDGIEDDEIMIQNRKEFELKMIKIWEYRQEQLHNIQNELIADMPTILKERIISIQQYINNPYEFINQLIILDDAKKNQENNDNDNDDNTDNDYTVQSNNIISILHDLEYHVSDVDMTRDFHTLHGWSILSSLLSDHIHNRHYDRVILKESKHSYNSKKNQTTNHRNHDDDVNTSSDNNNIDDGIDNDIDIDDDLWIRLMKSKIDIIQTNVAWVLGTAVKNTGEFTPYVLEEFSIVKTTHNKNKNRTNDDDDSSNNTTNSTTTTEIITTPLDLIYEQIQQTIQELNNNNYNYNNDINIHKQEEEEKKYYIIKQQKLDKLLYCLGSFLRGNRKAQIHFGAMGGSNLLKHILSNSIDNILLINHSNDIIFDHEDNMIDNHQWNHNNKKLIMKRIQRILQLVTDIIMEVTTIQHKYDHIDPTTNSILTSMSPEVSKAIVQSLTSSEWCHTIINSLDPSLVIIDPPTLPSSSSSSIRNIISHSEILFQTATMLSPYCISTWTSHNNTISIDTIISSSTQWIDYWQSIFQEQIGIHNDQVELLLDPDHYDELLQLSKQLVDQFINDNDRNNNVLDNHHDDTSSSTDSSNSNSMNTVDNSFQIDDEIVNDIDSTGATTPATTTSTDRKTIVKTEL